METAWRYILRLDQGLWDGADPPWLDYPAMMKIPVSSPAVLGRLKGFCKPFDFVLAPILRSDKLDPEERAEKPILVTRFNKHSDEWLDATCGLLARNPAAASGFRLIGKETERGWEQSEDVSTLLPSLMRYQNRSVAGERLRQLLPAGRSGVRNRFEPPHNSQGATKEAGASKITSCTLRRDRGAFWGTISG